MKCSLRIDLVSVLQCCRMSTNEPSMIRPASKVSRRKAGRLVYHTMRIGLERIHQVTNTIRIANIGW